MRIYNRDDYDLKHSKFFLHYKNGFKNEIDTPYLFKLLVGLKNLIFRFLTNVFFAKILKNNQKKLF